MSTKNPDGMMLRRDFYFYQQATVAGTIRHAYLQGNRLFIILYP